MNLPGGAERFQDYEGLHGLFKARPTGVMLDADTMEVVIGDLTLPAQACYAFGKQVVPTAAWLAKYKQQITVWCIFEEAQGNKCVWLGWSWIDGITKTDQYTFPDASVERHVHFHEVFDDSDEGQSWTVQQIDGNKQSIQVLKDSVQLQSKTYTSNVQGTATTTAKKIVEKSQDICLVDSDAEDPAVLGNELVQVLTDTLNNATQTLTYLQAFATEEAAVAAGNPQTAPMAAGFTLLAAQMGEQIAGVTEILSNLQGILSQYVKLK